MKRSTIVITTLLAAAALAAALYAAYLAGTKQGPHAPAAPASTAMAAPAAESEAEATLRHIAAGLKAGDIDPANGRRILYYHDPMSPGNKFDKPAKSPFMDMMLWPVYAEGGGGTSDASRVTISPRVQHNLGLRTAPVVEGAIAQPLAAVGAIAFDERDLAVVQARAAGYVERLHVRATFDPVAKGQPLVDLYVPEWVAAQEEFLSLRRAREGGSADLAPLVDAARQRLRQAGMDAAQIALVEASGTLQPRTTLVAPRAGVVAELAVREGMSIAAGATLFRINGLASVWANAEVPESQAALLRRGVPVRATSPALPGSVVEGRVQAVLPEVNPATRTIKARVVLANPGAKLVPGMFVQLEFGDARAARGLIVPTEAVMRTGRRNVVMLAEGEGHYRPVEVETGAEGGGQTEIRRGLQAGQQVVVSAQFLLDSEASLKGVEPLPLAGARP